MATRISLILVLLCVPPAGAANIFHTPDCISLWRGETGQLLTDSVGTNTFSSSAAVTADGAVYKEGAASLRGDNDFMGPYTRLADAGLSANTPFKNGTTNNLISVCYWFRPNGTYLPGWDDYMTQFSKYQDDDTYRSFHTVLYGYGGGEVRVGFNTGAASLAGPGRVDAALYYAESKNLQHCGPWGKGSSPGGNFGAVWSAAYQRGVVAFTAGFLMGPPDAELVADFPWKQGTANRTGTMTGWFNFTAITGSDQTITGKYEADWGGCIRALIDGSGDFAIDISISGSNVRKNLGTILTPGDWYFFGVYYRESDQTWQIWVYDETTSTPNAAGGSTGLILCQYTRPDIGNDGNNRSHFTGMIHSIAWWKAALSIADMGDVRTGAMDPQTNSNCVAYWRMQWGHVEPTTNILADQWYHVGITYNGVTGAWRVRVWDDTAASVAEATGTEPLPVSIGAAQLMLFQQNNNTYHKYRGYLDEVVLFGTILPAAEIDQIRQGTYGHTSGGGPTGGGQLIMAED
jgi:hypothetical protein